MTVQQQDSIRSIYYQYQDIIKPMVIALEIDDGEYPVEILNEIRAIMNHMAACHILDRSDDDKAAKKIDLEIERAGRHLKRAIFDCYKYICLSAEDFYEDFQFQMRHVDMSVIDNGKFVGKLHKKHTASLKALKKAKFAENASTKNDDDTVFDLFEKAFVSYSNLRDFIEKSMRKVNTARRKQFGSGSIGIVLSVIGLVLTTIGIILTL